MKKITLLLLLSFFSFTGYSQLALEGFESTTGPDALPSTNWTLGTGNWAVFDNAVGTGQRWGINSTVATPPIVYQGTNAAYVNRENIGQGNTSEDYLATPLVTIPSNGELHFYTRSFTNGNQGTIYQIKVAPATASQTNPAAYTLASVASQWDETTLNVTFNLYEEKVVDLSAYAGQQVYVSFVRRYTQPLTTLDGDRWLVDNVSIVQKCLEPTALTFSAINQNGVSLNWANPSGATSWEIEIVPAAGTPTGVGTVYNGTLPYVVTGLLPNTAYKFYVRAICSTGFNSIWAGPSATFTTSTAPPECGGNFVDAGGPTGNYANSSNITTTICPANPGDLVTVTFTAFALENNFDFLKVYDGNDATAPLLANLTGATLPPSFTSSATSGCLTFVFTSDGSVAAAGWIANITCDPAPTCPKPTALVSSAVTSAAATLAWTNNSSATAFQVIALPCGSPIPTATTVGWIDTTNNPYTFTGLSSATCYDLYVRAICSTTDSSTASNPTTITTQVAPPQCGGNFVDAGGVSANYANSSNITTTICPTNPGEKVTVTFTFFNTEATWDGLYVYNGNTVTPTQLLPSANPAGNVPGGLAGSYWGNLTGAALPGPFTSTSADGCLTFVFRSDGSVNNPGWVSNITCALPPACQQPTNLTATNFTTTTAQLGWVSPGTATSWQVIALPAGSPAPLPTDTGWTAAPTNPFVLTGLTPGTAYEYYVRGDCGTVDGVSLWSGPKAFATIPTCPAPTTLTTSNVLSTSAQLNWTSINPSVSWQVIALPCGSPAPTAGTTGFIDVSTNPYIFTGLTPNTCYDFYVRGVCTPTDISFWSAVATATTQVAPPVCGGTFTDPGGPTANYANSTDSTVTICPNPGEVVTVTFTAFDTEATWDGLYVFDGNSILSPQIASTNPAGNVPGGLAGSFWGTTIPGPFTSSSNDGCLTFRFRSDGSVNRAGWIADVTCAPAPNCLKPITLTATNITATSASLGWTETNAAITQWEVIILPLGSPVPLPTATGTIVSTNPALFTGLTPGTQYTFYVRGLCPTSGTSAWSTGFNFNTLLSNDECSGATFAAVNSSAVCQQITPGSIAGATASASPAIAPCIGTADDDVWFQFIATNTYLNVALQNVTGSTTNLNFAAYSGQCGTLTQIFCSANNALSGVLNNLTIGQTYYIRVYSNASTPQSTTFNLCISTPSTCPTASTVCSLTNYANTTGVTSLGTIGCLFTSPNPAYFTIQVNTSGPINFTLTQSTTPGGAPNIDVDYAAWGPFVDQAAACAAIGGPLPTLAPGIGVPVTQQTGCSYSAAPTETLNIANAVAGQFYIILITNFSNQAGYISLTQNNLGDAGHGTTLCCPDAYFSYSPVSYCKEVGVPNPIPTIANGSISGVFSSTITPGLVFVNTATGEIDLQASAPGNYVITNTVAATATCVEKVKSFTINISAPTSATIAYGAASYCKNITALQNVTITGTTGGTFSASPNGGLYIDAVTGAINPSLSAPGIYTITYALPGSGICVSSNPTAQVEIIGAPNIVQPASVSACNTYTLPALTVGDYYSQSGGLGTPLDITVPITSTQTIYIYGDNNGCTNEKSFSVTINTAPTPTLNVTQPTCAVQTGTIEVTAPVVTGGGLPSNLFISEVTDAAAGSLTYVEIFNGTGASVDLSNYRLKVYNNGSTTSSCDLLLSGTIANNSTNVIKLSSDANISGVTPNQSFTGCGGVNIDDNIRLTTSSNVEIDNWGRTDGVSYTPLNQPGYTYRRINTATVPSLTWNPSDWTTTDPEDYSNVGSYALPTFGYEYSLDNGTYQSSTTFGSVAPGDHTITVHDLATGCYSDPVTVTLTIVPQNPSVTTFTYPTTPVCQNATQNPVPDISAVGFTSGGVFSSTTGLAINASTGEIDLANSTAGTYVVTYSVADNTTTCQLAGSSTFTIVINPVITPVTGFSYTSPVCKNGTNPTPISVTGFTTGGSYTSTTGLSINSSTGVIDLANSIAGTYVVTYTVAANVANCQVVSSSTASITINPVITPVTTFSYSSPVCAFNADNLQQPILGQGFTLGGVFSSTNGLSINPSTGVITVSGSTPGDYTITYTLAADASICQLGATSTAQITISAPFQISIDAGCQSVNYVLTALPVDSSFNPETVSYSWQNGSGQIIGTTQSITVTETGSYFVSITSGGCSSNSLPVSVDSINCVIQKGISVNNDGKNDTFDLTGFNVKKLTIFNRYGLKVYDKDNYTNQWGGQSNTGDELPDGTYYYVIARDNGENKTGWIYINRAQ